MQLKFDRKSAAQQGGSAHVHNCHWLAARTCIFTFDVVLDRVTNPQNLLCFEIQHLESTFVDYGVRLAEQVHLLMQCLSLRCVECICALGITSGGMDAASMLRTTRHKAASGLCLIANRCQTVEVLITSGRQQLQIDWGWDMCTPGPPCPCTTGQACLAWPAVLAQTQS